ncbi:MAG: insulinase family protein [Sphaerochaetaceae bacterium]
MNKLNIGDEIGSFVLESIDQLDDYQGSGYLFRHRITNMEVYHVANDDIVNYFAFIFKTPPVDDCGTPHIIEHTILAGSKRFNVKDPFMELLKGSVNTFMNGLTYPDYTIYPAASPLYKDYKNLFKVYADAVFNPLLRKETFWQEGIRLSIDNEDNLQFDGVVFNEMLGEFSNHDSIVARQSVRTLFPDTPYFYESGGDPKAIIDLDYRQLQGYYVSHYHPSNCRLFLYGNQDVTDQLNLLEKLYLSEYSISTVEGPSKLAKKWKKGRSFSTTSGSETTDVNGSVTINWATTLVEDPLEVLTLQILVDVLLGNPGAPLYKAIIESSLAKDISQVSGMDTSFRQMPFTVGFKGIEPSKSEDALKLVLDTLENLVKKGLNSRQVRNAIRRQEFVLREATGDIPVGFRAMNRSIRGWAQKLHPSTTIQISPTIAQLKEKLKEDKRYFESWIKTNLIDNPHRSVLIVKPDPSYNEELENHFNNKLESIKEAMDESSLEDLRKENLAFDEFEERVDTEEDLLTIPRLTTEDLPKEIRILEQEKHIVEDVVLYQQQMETNGIIYTDGFFKLENLTKEQILLLPIFARMLQLSGVGKYSYDEMAIRIRSKVGGLFFFLESSSTLFEKDPGFLALGFRLKALTKDNKAALDLVAEILNGVNLDDLGRLKATINDLSSDFESNVSSAAQLYASQRATASFSEILYKNELLNGLEQWFFLNTIDVNDEKQLLEISKQLQVLHKMVVGKENLILHLCSDSKQNNFLGNFIKKFDSVKFNKDKVNLEPLKLKQMELYRIPASVSYNALAFRAESESNEIQAHQTVLTYILATNHLWEKVRQVGGAYGVFSQIDQLEALALFASYRDPRIMGTLSDFRVALVDVANNGVSEKVLDQAIISIVGRDLRPLYPKDASMIAFRRELYNITDEYRKTRRVAYLSTTVEDLKIAAQRLLDSLEKESSTVVIGGQKVLAKEELEKDSIKLPL